MKISPLSRIYITFTIMCFIVGIVAIARGAVSNGFICLVFGFAGLVTIIKARKNGDGKNEDKKDKK